MNPPTRSYLPPLRMASLLAGIAAGSSSHAAALSLSQVPLFTTSTAKANVLVVLDNSNSMDEAPSGSAAGSNSASSKSEIARGVIRNLISEYTGRISMGLMAYQQGTLSSYYLHNSPYDVSYDSANYDADYSGDRDSKSKRYAIDNPSDSDPAHQIYYNISLPFYASSSQGNGFCYAPTADFDNGSETYPDGPWDTYRCFTGKTGTQDGVVSPLPSGSIKTSETSLGYSGLIGTFPLYPTDSDLAQGILDFGQQLTWQVTARTWFRNDSPGRGYLHTPIASLEGTQITTLTNKLACNVPSGTPVPADAQTCTTSGIPNAGLTPIEGTLLTASDYFAGKLTDTAQGGPQSAPPESCGKDFTVLLTDGLPSTNASGVALTDPEQALKEAAAAAEGLHGEGVESYIVGFALPYGVDPSTLDTIAASGGTGSAYLAEDTASLTETFDTIFTDILAKTGSAASAATNSTSLGTGTVIYQARFNSGNWAGQLIKKDIDTAGNIADTGTDFGSVLDAQSPSSRVMLTRSRDTGDGIAFTWTNLAGQTDQTQATALNTDATGTVDNRGSERVDWLRGSTVSGMRDRAGLLGDIVLSTPFHVGKPQGGYTGTSYASFASTHLNRTPVLYVGGNDGMLHGFDADSGKELLAYIPGELYEHLSALSHPNYGNTALLPLVPHRYFVDGSPMAGDAQIGGNWKTVLIGGLNAGGQGYYALDVTDPSGFSEANAANLALWEFTDEDDADLGYTFNQPPFDQDNRSSAQIVQLNNDKWAVIVGNGYNNTEADGHASTTGHAALFILFLDGGTDGSWTVNTDYIKLDTGAGSTTTPNGLSTPLPVDTNGDDKADLVYAGDLQGNVWKFDLTSTTASSWSVGHLYQALDSNTNPQPITTAPLVTPHPSGGYMIGFGTGKYLELTDLSSTTQQTVYGIRDPEPGGSAGNLIDGRSDLQEQTLIATTTVSGTDYRVTSDTAIDYDTQQGWYFDLPETGERIAYNPLARDQYFVFVTLIPDTSDPCAAGGSSWLMEFDYLNGARPTTAVIFDVNDDGKIDDSDTVTVTDANGNPLSVPPTGAKLTNGIGTTPAVLDKDETTEVKVVSGSTAELQTVLEKKGAKSGRLSWRQILDE